MALIPHADFVLHVNGLQKPSQVMVDKAMTVKRDQVGQAFGRIQADALVEVERCLALFLGIAQ